MERSRITGELVTTDGTLRGFAVPDVTIERE
jgi:hypothetical protein